MRAVCSRRRKTKQNGGLLTVAPALWEAESDDHKFDHSLGSLVTQGDPVPLPVKKAGMCAGQC